MDWDTRYVISPSLTLKISPAGKLVLLGSDSRRRHEMEVDALPVLVGFAAGATPREVLGRLQEEWDLQPTGFETIVGALADQEILAPAATLGSQRKVSRPGFGSVRSHFFLLKDTARVMSYRAAIERHCPGKMVVEIGCGTGILSLFAARAGARRVIAIEETAVAELADRMFAANGCAAAIDLRNANSRFVELDEPADLLIHEILGVDPFEENLLPTLADARQRLLRPGGRLLPYRLEVCCLGIEPERTPIDDEERMLAEAKELPRLYGLDFEPFLRALAGAAEAPSPQRTWIGGTNRFEPKILTEECQLLGLNLATDPLDLPGWTGSVPLRVIRNGSLGGVVLYFRAHLDEEIQLTTSPHAPATHWGWDVRTFSRRVSVAAGDEVALVVELKGQSEELSVQLA